MYFLNNSAEPPARPANALFGNVIPRVIFLEKINLWIHTRDSSNGFRSHEFVSGLGAGNLELMLSEQKEVGEYLYLHASSPSTHEWFLEAVYSNRSPMWRSVLP